MSKIKAKVFYDAGWQGMKVRWLSAAFIPIGTAMVPGAFWVTTSLRDVAGNLEPFEARLGLAALLLVTGLLCSLGMWIYLQIYPMRLIHDGDTVYAEMSTVVSKSIRAIPVEHFGAVATHEGRFGTFGSAEHRIGVRHSIHTPFKTVGIVGWRLPMIIDGQADMFDATRFEQVLKSGTRKRARRATAANARNAAA